jgi:glycerate 2-kinase
MTAPATAALAALAPGHILICLDKFRGSATAPEACRALAEGIRATAPGRRVLERPVADGGEGTADALVAAGYRPILVQVGDPVGRPVLATLAVRGDRAVVELAQASGLHLLSATGRAPLTATTHGTGQLIRAALDLGCRDVVLTVGGSASTDGGAGMLQALGARITGPDGTETPPGGAALATATHVELSGLDPRLRETRLTVATDVDNPLLGPHGAAAVFAPQKGADPAQVELLEAGLRNFSRLMASATGRQHAEQPGSGAAGGTGFAAFAALGAYWKSGTQLVLAELGLERALPGAALVVVGEGALDAQSLRGKAPVGVAALARSAGVPVIAVAGRVEVTDAELAAHGIGRSYSLLSRAGTPAAAMADAPGLLREIGRDIGLEIAGAGRPSHRFTEPIGPSH